MLAATSRPSLALIERMPSRGRSAFTVRRCVVGVERRRRRRAGFERVADAVHGAHAVGPDLGAQGLHVAVERAGAAGVGPAPHLAHQLVAPRTAPGSAARASSRSNSSGVRCTSLARAATRREPRSTVRSPTVEHRRLLGGELARPVDAAQQGPDAGDDLAHPERLGDVVVGADAETDEQVGLVGARREHEDRHRPLAPGCDGTPRARRSRAA